MSQQWIHGLLLASCSTALSATAFADTPEFINPTREELIQKDQDAASVLRESLSSSDRSIPQDLLNQAVCVATIPNVLRIGYIFAGKIGTGLVSCRTVSNGAWSAPSYIKIKGGSWGFQVGIDSTDLMLVFVNPNAAQVFSRANITLGGDLSITAGPLGRSASTGTDYRLKSEIYSYSHSQGLFAGIALEGSVVTVDRAGNQVMYNSESAAGILSSRSNNSSSYVNTLATLAPRAE